MTIVLKTGKGVCSAMVGTYAHTHTHTTSAEREVEPQFFKISELEHIATDTWLLIHGDNVDLSTTICT